LVVTSAATYRLVKDGRGSVRQIVDVATGAVMEDINYDSWGRVLSDTNPGFQAFGFAGGLYEPETGLVRFGRRDYDAEIGRWTSKDPLGLDGGLNTYVYVGGDPVNRTDPSGLFGPGDFETIGDKVDAAVQKALNKAASGDGGSSEGSSGEGTSGEGSSGEGGPATGAGFGFGFGDLAFAPEIVGICLILPLTLRSDTDTTPGGYRTPGNPAPPYVPDPRPPQPPPPDCATAAIICRAACSHAAFAYEECYRGCMNGYGC